ncbi:MAG: hypothetical protein HDT47_03570 [Ruminococcaceae bacterium]|nr:hypothetical protein [Oscillospiraceae bacterium]
MEKTTKLLPTASVCAVVIAVIFRVFQLLVTVDYNEMGFYSADAGFLSTWGLYVFLVIAAAVFIAAAVKDNKSMNTAFLCNKDSLTPKQTAVLGISFLVGACLKFYVLVFNFKGIGLDFLGEGVIFLVFAAIGFVLLGSRKIKAGIGYLMLIISISYTLKAAALFMQDTIITRVSDELILLLSYVSAVFFFLSLGRFISTNEGKGTRHKLLIFSAVSACLSSCASLAGCIAYLIDSEYMKDHTDIHPVSEIGVIILAFAVLFVLYGKKAETDTDNENDENKKTDENAADEMPSV